MNDHDRSYGIEINIPKVFDFGSGEVVEVDHLCQMFGIKRRTAFCYLDVLHIIPIYIGKEVFFSLSTFNRIMFVLTRPGGPGIILPGSLAKNNKRLRAAGCLTEVTNEILAKAMQPETLAEMAAASGRDPIAVRKYASYRGNKSKGEKNDL